jgi:hypothetical protein
MTFIRQRHLGLVSWSVCPRRAYSGCFKICKSNCSLSHLGGLCLTYDYAEKYSEDKHPSLFVPGVSEKEKRHL